MALFGDIDPTLYQQQIADKVALLAPQFARFTNLVPSVCYSQPKHYRMRAEFGIFHDQEQCHYFMVNKNGKEKTKVLLDHFDPGSLLINKYMPLVTDYVSKVAVLKEKLFSVDFLTTLSNHCLITLTYHKKLDDTWQQAGQQFFNYLQQLTNTDELTGLIGRANKQKLIFGSDKIQEAITINGKTFYSLHQDNSFTQPNGGINQQMLSWVKNHIADAEHDLLELYCGNGNFSLVLAEQFRKVLATEIAKASIEAADYGITANHITNMQIARMSAEEFTQAMNKEREFKRLKLAKIQLDDYDFSTILVDPPRAGLDDATVKLVQNYNTIVYISCNPYTLLQNLETITQTHAIQDLCFFDQFPYTEHVETAVLLSKKK